MSIQDPTEEQIVQAIYALASEQIKSGSSEQEVQSMLVGKGLDQKSAATVIYNLTQARIRAEAIHEVGRKSIFYGALWFIGGIVVTVVTYITAISGSGGGTYFVTWGAVLYGAIQFIRGLMQLREG